MIIIKKEEGEFSEGDKKKRRPKGVMLLWTRIIIIGYYTKEKEKNKNKNKNKN